jgi:hypothetical protein
MERDETCRRDAENFKARFGEYPAGMRLNKPAKNNEKEN